MVLVDSQGRVCFEDHAGIIMTVPYDRLGEYRTPPDYKEEWKKQILEHMKIEAECDIKLALVRDYLLME
jgi:hypothetical protein